LGEEGVMGGGSGLGLEWEGRIEGCMIRWRMAMMRELPAGQDEQ
jgi:hypothetical protein